MARPRTIVGIGILGVLLFAFPGLLSYDSLFQLDEARRWDLGDAHPPAMGALWRLCEVLVAGPLGMLVLQVTALGIGMYLILSTELAPRRAAIAALAIAWFPPVMLVMGVIWKDSQMAGYLMLGIAGLLAARRSIRICALGALLLASAMRHNAPAATFAPVILLLGAGEARWWQRYLVPAAAWLAITAGGFTITRVLAQHHRAMFADSIAMTDLAGTIRWAHPMTDDELRALLAGTPLRADHDIQAAFVAHYHPNMYLGIPAEDPLQPPTTPEEAAAIARAWRVLLEREPIAYLHHRWTVFTRFFNVKGRAAPPLVATFSNDEDPARYARVSHDAAPSAVQRAWFAVIRATSGIWYAPFVYMIIALVLLGMVRTRLELAVLASGMLYEAGLFPFALNPDFRYSHWLITTTIVTLVLVVSRRARPRDMRS